MFRLFACVCLAFASLVPAVLAGEIEELEKRIDALNDAGKFAEAIPLAQEALARREKAGGPDDLATQKAVLTLASLHDDAGEPALALPLYLRAVATLERTRGPVDAEVATARNGLAALHYGEGRLAEAREEWLRVLVITEKTAGPESFPAVRVLANLASVEDRLSNPAQAQRYYERALAAAEKTLGPEHRVTLMVMGNFGNFRKDLGDFAQAEPLLQRALEAKRKVFGAEHPIIAEALFNLANNAQQAGRYPEAAAGYRASLALMQKTAGPESARTARVLSALAEVLGNQLKFDEAADLAQQALAMLEIQRGPDHPDVAEALRDAGTIELRRTGGPRDAELMQTRLERALAIYEQRFGPTDRQTVSTLDKLALAAHRAGRVEAALGYATRALRGKEALIANVLTFAPEALRLGLQARLDCASVPAVLGRAELIAEAVLHTKAIVLDSLLEDRRLLAAGNDPGVRDRIEAARAVRQQLTRARGEARSDAQQEKVRALAAESERLETALTRDVAALGRARRALSTQFPAVRAALAADTVLIEFVRYTADAPGPRDENARYGALVIAPGLDTAPRWVALAAAREIDEQVRRIQRAAAAGGAELPLEAALRALHARVWEPVHKVLPATAARIVISPDAALNSVSFAALLAGDGSFVGEKLAVSYVSAGRDLIASAGPTRRAEQSLLAFANPKFDRTATLLAAAGPGGSDAMRGLSFLPLPGAETEGRALAELVRAAGWKSELFVAGEATEKRLRETVRGPRILHLATHGFYLPPPASGLTLLANPMRRSGLALAGAAATLAAWERGEAPDPADDGILTAEEVSDLDLQGTWLVTLSACESGAGEARIGEGVLGLRRGMALAGAQHLLLTLWPVADRETQEFMREFYASALQSGDPAAALARVQREHLIRIRKERSVGAAARLVGPFIVSAHGQ